MYLDFIDKMSPSAAEESIFNVDNRLIFCLYILIEIGYEDFPAAEIVKSLEDVQLKATKQHGETIWLYWIWK